jgi:drug/metabolite transporter (DMT)-like permease
MVSLPNNIGNSHMVWILFSFLSHIFWGSASIFDKYIVGNRITNTNVFFVLTHCIGLGALFLIPWLDFSLPSGVEIIWIIFAGILYSIGLLIYFYVVSIEEISRINIWWNLIPFFSLIIGWFAIDEHPSYNQLFSMVFLLT